MKYLFIVFFLGLAVPSFASNFQSEGHGGTPLFSSERPEGHGGTPDYDPWAEKPERASEQAGTETTPWFAIFVLMYLAYRFGRYSSKGSKETVETVSPS